MASFQAETCRDKPKKRKKKFLVRKRFYPNQAREFQKKSKKIENHHFGFISSRSGLDKPKKTEKKKIFSFGTVFTRHELEYSK